MRFWKKERSLKDLTRLQPFNGLLRDSTKLRPSKEKGGSLKDLTQLRAFKEMAVNLLLKIENTKEKVFLVSSTLPETGKTTISFNLASVLSTEDKKVLLVSDYDGSFEGIDVAKGPFLEDLLTAKDEIGGEITPLLVTVREPSSFKLYDRKVLKGWLERMKRSFDLIVIEMPALPHPLPLLLIPIVDGVILIADTEKTRQTSLIRAKEVIEKAGGNIVGIVLNKYSSPIPPIFSRWLQLEE